MSLKNFALKKPENESGYRWGKPVALFFSGLSIFLVYSLLYTAVFKFEPPKTLYLESKNRALIERIEKIDQIVARQNQVLNELQMRDNVVYRPIFGMGEISAEVRNAGFGGVDRYSYLDKFENSHLLIDSRMKLDMVSKKASIQSLSYDDVAAFSKRAEEMASCVPSIYPVVPSSKFRITSSYGYRSDPFKGVSKMHSGIDIGGPKGEPIFATGNGVVSRVAYNYYGYGNIVEIDHGFGYKTLYGHLTMATVAEGQTISKGDQIGTLGSTGRSTAPHLHYEVRYREKTVNPWNYFLNDMDEEEYKSIVRLSTPGARRR